MAKTISDEVFAKVEALTRSGVAVTRAAAIREVAEETGRSVSATSSAFYAGSRRAKQAAASPAGGARRGRGSRRPDSPALYSEMLPLVEAGASVEQAARRFGDDDSVAEIAAGFARWRERERRAGPAQRPGGDRRAGEHAVLDAEGRITALEAENRGLRRDLIRARQALARIQAIVDTASG